MARNELNENETKRLSRRQFTKISLTAIAVGGVTAFLKKVLPPVDVWSLGEFPTNKLVHAAFRLTDHHSLLNLEFYFINCEYKEGESKVWAKYGPYENYMVVRLPQQHIAEQSFSGRNPPYKAVTYISNYSYLVFRILFPDDGFFKSMFTDNDGKYAHINLNKEDLLKWGDESKFRLVVRQDLTESLFDLANTGYYNLPDTTLQRLDYLRNLNSQDTSVQSEITTLQSDSTSRRKDSLENHYPFQQAFKDSSQKKIGDSTLRDTLKIAVDTFSLNDVPKAYGDPITAIELPWRLIISPKLPDSSRFKFKWDIPETDLYELSKSNEDKNRHKLWMATLSIKERDDDEYKARKKADAKKNQENPQAPTGSLNDVINQLELMILGSPDYPIPSDKYKDILPRGAHRKDLVALYIKLKVLARTEKLTLSAIGATVKIHLKNNDFEKALKLSKPIGPVGVIEWNQIISLGRDEKVEVSTLFLEAEFGHKMAYIEIAERRLQDGVYVLIKTPYIMPLDISKDYTNHITQTTDIKDNDGKPQIISRFNAPFKKITFLETKPKELFPDRFSQTELTQTQTAFQFEAIDWHDNIVTFSKNINALPFGAVVKEGWLDDKKLIQKIIADATNAMYYPGTSTEILPDTVSIPIKADTILNREFLKDSTTIFVKQIDDSLVQLRKCNNQIDSISQILLAKSTYSTVSRDPTQEITQFREYFDTFFQYVKAKIDSPTNLEGQQLNSILNKIEAINVNDLIVYIINQFVIPSQDILLKVMILKDERGDYPFEYLKKLKKEDIKVSDLFQEVENDSNRKDFINVIAASLSDLNEEYRKGFKVFYTRVFMDFPEVTNQIRQLKNLFDNAKNDLDQIISQIKKKLNILFSIEQTAKNIPGLILLQKQKIGYAIKEKYDDVEKTLGATRQQLISQIADATGQVKKSLSELESEYIIFKGGLKEGENKAFDFFHEYAIIPQVKQAKVYVSALNKLVNEDIPISINYARDYLENQARDGEFEVEQNAAMVFAEVQQYSREQVKGLIQKIGDKMPGLNVEMPVHFLTYARNPQELEDKALKTVGDALGISGKDVQDFKENLQQYSRDLVFISEDVKNAVKVMEDLKNTDPKKYFKDLGAKLFGSIGLEDILDIGFDLPRLTQLPDKLIYQVSTDKFKNFEAAFVVFKPNVKSSNPTRLELFISKSLKNRQEYYAYTQLNNFSVGMVIGGTEVLTVTFDQFKITSAPNQPKKTDVSITDVKVGGPLEFIADLAKRFMAPGNGMRIKAGPRNLLVDYTIALPDIKAPAFNFRNLQFIIGVNIPYDPSTLKPISFNFGVNSPEDKFLVSAGIYGGRGHFQLQATPKGIEHIDVAIELGAYGSIDLGIGKGEVFLFFGFWFVTGRDNQNQNYIKAVAYVLCAGSATVLGFITIGVSVLIALTYIKRGETSLFYGEAVVTYSVKIAFFKKEFSIKYYKEIAGSSKGNNTQSLQTGVILLDTATPGGVSLSGDTDARRFEDVFENTNVLKEYILCFA